MTCQLILTNKVCAAVLLLWVMQAMFNRISLFCCNGHQGTVLMFVEVLTKPPRLIGNDIRDRKAGDNSYSVISREWEQDEI